MEKIIKIYLKKLKMSSFKLLIEKRIVEYEATPNYGLITEKSIILDDYNIFREFLIGYRLHKIKCWIEKNNGIVGIQLCYKDRETNEEIISIDKNKQEEFISQEFILDSLEVITQLIIWKKDSLKGFEVNTNKKRIKRFGYDEGERIIPEEFEEKNINIILGFFFTYEPNIGISSIGCYYCNRKKFATILYSGILYLRIKLKNENFKNETQKRLNDMDFSDRALYYTCLLPNKQFFGILKYALS